MSPAPRSAMGGAPAADVLVRRARVWSDGAPLDADAIAVRGGAILDVGREAALAPLVRPGTRVVDANGATVTPGLADAHLHLLAWARGISELAMGGLSSRAEAVEAVRRFAAAHPDAPVLVGRGWSAERWAEPPDRAGLDAVAPDRPVLLHAHDFHTVWVNSAALRAAGINRRAPDPEGGRFERDAAGEPTGIVREHAVRAFAALEAQAPRTDDAQALTRAVATLHARGITQVHDFEAADAMRALHALAVPRAAPDDVARARGPALRVLMHLPHAALDAALALGIASGTGDLRFRIGALKLFADGTLGSRTAAMLAPFEDAGGAGLDLIAPAALRDIVARAFAGGLSVAIHAIGDRAVRASLDAFEAAGPWAAKVALPPRVEHVQLADAADVPRFATLGVAASVQPQFVPSDGEAARRAWGARAERAYAWRTLRTSGALVAFGSDAPVESPGGAAMLHAAVTRSDAAGRVRPLAPGECLDLDAALACATETPARLAGWWPALGRLAPGAAADLVLWSHDLHALPPARLHEAGARLTMIDGAIVFEAPQRAPVEPVA